MTIADINDRNDLALVTDSTDNNMARNDYPELFDLGCGCDSFFVKVGKGEFTEIYGFRGIVPTLAKALHVHLIKGSGTLISA